MKFRKEEDSLGKRRVPEAALYGIQSERARDNFKISGCMLPPLFIRSYASVKKAAALANMELGLLDHRRADAIIQACNEIIRGRHEREFIVDAFQAGAGTSQNMNINEVIANRSIEILKGKRGNYSIVHPNDHVNMSQSSNDTFPTAMRISILLMQASLLDETEKLGESFHAKANRFRRVLKSGRTHLQDAVPVTLGQEFSAYEASIASAALLIKNASRSLLSIPLGGTAAGTGLNAHPDFRRRAVKNLSAMTELKLKSGKNLMNLIQSTSDFASYSSALRILAIELIKISNDIRFLSSGPMTGIAEIRLPAVQPGSSIMPGKVNPVICEALAMVCFQVIGNDAAVTLASQAGQLELNVMTPVIIHNILGSIEILKNSISILRTRCIDGLRADEARCRRYFESSQGLATVLNPVMGYSKASEIVRESMKTGEGILDTIRKRRNMKEDEVRELFTPLRLIRPSIWKRPTERKKGGER